MLNDLEMIKCSSRSDVQLYMTTDTQHMTIDAQDTVGGLGGLALAARQDTTGPEHFFTANLSTRNGIYALPMGGWAPHAVVASQRRARVSISLA